MKLNLKFQITKFMSVILLFTLVLLSLQLNAENITRNIIDNNTTVIDNSTNIPTSKSIVVAPDFNTIIQKEAKKIETEKAENKSSNLPIIMSHPSPSVKSNLKKIKTNKRNYKNIYNFKIPYYKIKQGETKLVIVSNLGLNHIRINIKNPYVYTASNAKIKVDGYNIFVDTVGLHKPVDLFIEAPNGNVYSLTLIPKQVPPQSLYFKAIDYHENEFKENLNQIKNTYSNNNQVDFVDYYYVERIKDLIKKMALSEDIQGYIKEDESNTPIQELNDLQSKLITKYIGSILIGEVWKLKNVGVIPIKISPKDFYYPGVLAVSIELKSNLKYRILRPQETCYLYIVKRIKNEGDNE